MPPNLLSVAHPRFHLVDAAIFSRRVVVDCMNHRCHLVASHQEKLDACCQYGADVDVGERDAIMAHQEELRAVLQPDAAAATWFETDEDRDPDFPSGRSVRTRVHGDGCIFLSHDQRGCAIHRVALAGDWDMRGVKPHVCRLFPLTYDRDTIHVSDDYPDYSCADHPGAPTLYRAGRDLLAELFGDELVVALDLVETAAIAAAPRRLAVVDAR